MKLSRYFKEQGKRVILGKKDYRPKHIEKVYASCVFYSNALAAVRQKYTMFDFTHSDNVEFICMYGYNTTLKDDVERFRFLRSLPGAYVFVQQYQPIPKGPVPELKNFFDDHADKLIDELITILFPQNMKSMEKYYRWLSRFYAETFGKLHERLVDVLFKYNSRDRKGRYIATLTGTRQANL